MMKSKILDYIEQGRDAVEEIYNENKELCDYANDFFEFDGANGYEMAAFFIGKYKEIQQRVFIREE